MNAQTKLKQAKIAKVLDYCRGGKTSMEIREFTGIPKSSINNFLSELQMSGDLYKVVPEVEYFRGMGPVPCWFVTTGTECDREPPVILPKDAPDPKWNQEFIRVAHKCLHLGAA